MLDNSNMSVIAGRPIKTVDHLTSIHGVLVQCRLADGTDVHIPMSELYRLFAEEMTKQTQAQKGLRQ